MGKSVKFSDFFKNSAEKFFLAGLGAISIAEEKGARFLEELVEKGRNFEKKDKDLSEKAAGGLSHLKMTAEGCKETLEKTIDEKLKKAIHKLGIPSSEEISELTKKVEALSGSVDSLLSKNMGGLKTSPEQSPDHSTGSQE